MGDFQNQQVGGEQDDLQNRDAQSVAQELPATAQVRAMLASRDPQAIGEIIRNNPEARSQIYALLHKTLGNRFVSQVEQFAVIGTGVQGKAPSEQNSREVMNDFREVNGDQGRGKPPSDKDKAEVMADVRAVDAGPNHAPGTGLAPTKFSQKGRDDLPEMLANLESSTPAAAPSSPTSAPDEKARARGAALAIDDYEADLKAPSKQPDASDANKPQAAAPSGIAPTKFSQKGRDELPEMLANLEPSTPAAATASPAPDEKARARGAALAIDDYEADLKAPGKPSGAPAPKMSEAPVEASKVLKDETVIGASAEVKQPEILRASEVLKDPNQGDEPQKASEVVKDDDAENEGSGGGQKADVGPVKITASVLRVRSSPKLGKGNIVGRLTKGTVVEAIGHSGEWVEIQYKGQTAFVHSSFVVGAQEAAIPKASDQVAPATAT